MFYKDFKRLEFVSCRVCVTKSGIVGCYCYTPPQQSAGVMTLDDAYAVIKTFSIKDGTPISAIHNIPGGWAMSECILILLVCSVLPLASTKN